MSPIWANATLLLCLSLIAFATAYVGGTDLASFPTLVYGALQFACGLTFFLIVSTIAAQRRDEGEFMAAFRPRRRQDVASLPAYALATAVAAFGPIAAPALFVLVGLAYVTPGLVAEISRRKARLEA